MVLGYCLGVDVLILDLISLSDFAIFNSVNGSFVFSNQIIKLTYFCFALFISCLHDSWVTAASIEIQGMHFGFAWCNLTGLLVSSHSLIWATSLALSFNCNHLVDSTNWGFTSLLGNNGLVVWARKALSLPGQVLVSFTFWFSAVTILLKNFVDTTSLSVTSEVT